MQVTRTIQVEVLQSENKDKSAEHKSQPGIKISIAIQSNHNYKQAKLFLVTHCHMNYTHLVKRYKIHKQDFKSKMA